MPGSPPDPKDQAETAPTSSRHHVRLGSPGTTSFRALSGDKRIIRVVMDELDQMMRCLHNNDPENKTLDAHYLYPVHLLP